jgi:hypothetical protein
MSFGGWFGSNTHQGTSAHAYHYIDDGFLLAIPSYSLFVGEGLENLYLYCFSAVWLWEIFL